MVSGPGKTQISGSFVSPSTVNGLYCGGPGTLDLNRQWQQFSRTVLPLRETLALDYSTNTAPKLGSGATNAWRRRTVPDREYWHGDYPDDLRRHEHIAGLTESGRLTGFPDNHAQRRRQFSRTAFGTVDFTVGTSGSQTFNVTTSAITTNGCSGPARPSPPSAAASPGQQCPPGPSHILTATARTCTRSTPTWTRPCRRDAVELTVNSLRINASECRAHAQRDPIPISPAASSCRASGRNHYRRHAHRPGRR